MNYLRAVIVEDEIHNLELMSHFIEQYCPKIEVVGQAQSKQQAVDVIDQQQPDLMFLDIRLQDETAFDVLENIQHRDFQVIFTTAYDEYAIQAFHYNTVDYLLKPIQIEELILAVTRADDRHQKQIFFQKEQWRQMEDHSPANNGFVAISNVDKISFVKQEEIIYCKSSGRYTEFFLTNDRSMVASKLLGTYQEEMNPKLFFRTHKSYLVNVRYIKNIHRRDGHYCEMTSNDHVPVSRRRLDELMQFLKLH